MIAHTQQLLLESVASHLMFCQVKWIFASLLTLQRPTENIMKNLSQSTLMSSRISKIKTLTQSRKRNLSKIWKPNQMKKLKFRHLVEINGKPPQTTMTISFKMETTNTLETICWLIFGELLILITLKLLKTLSENLLLCLGLPFYIVIYTTLSQTVESQEFLFLLRVTFQFTHGQREGTPLLISSCVEKLPQSNLFQFWKKHSNQHMSM